MGAKRACHLVAVFANAYLIFSLNFVGIFAHGLPEQLRIKRRGAEEEENTDHNHETKVG